MCTPTRGGYILTPRDLLTSCIPGVLSLWQAAPGPGTARDLLAVWAGLQRLVPEPHRQDWWREAALRRAVRRDRQALVDVADVAFDLDRWLADVERLDADTDVEPSDAEELDGRAWELFRRLDQAALVAWAVGHLGGVPPGLNLAPAWAVLRDRVDLFFGLAEDIADVLSAVRPDLYEADPDLAETLLPHQRVVEACEDADV